MSWIVEPTPGRFAAHRGFENEAVTFVICHGDTVFVQSAVTLLLLVSRHLPLPLGLLLVLTVVLPSAAQDSLGMHISPMLINVEVGEEQPLQVLDANGKELTSSGRSVDSAELAEIRRESGQIVLFPKSAGVVHVWASIEGRTLTGEIKIWSLEPRMS